MAMHTSSIASGVPTRAITEVFKVYRSLQNRAAYLLLVIIRSHEKLLLLSENDFTILESDGSYTRSCGGYYVRTRYIFRSYDIATTRF